MRKVSATVGVLVAGLALTSAALFLLAKSVMSDARNEEEVRELRAEVARHKRLRREERVGRTAAEKKLRAKGSGEAKTSATAMFPGGQAVAAALDVVHFHVIARVKSCFPDRRGVPRQPMLCPATRGEITFCKALAPSGEFIRLGGGAAR